MLGHIIHGASRDDTSEARNEKKKLRLVFTARDVKIKQSAPERDMEETIERGRERARDREGREERKKEREKRHIRDATIGDLLDCPLDFILLTEIIVHQFVGAVNENSALGIWRKTTAVTSRGRAEVKSDREPKEKGN